MTDTKNQGYEFFDHTADVGVKASGATLSELFIQMAHGFTELIADNTHLTPREERSIALTADDPQSLLMAWLQELLFWFSTDRFLPAAFELKSVTETSLQGHVKGDRFDPRRHTCGTEVKGITRHQLRVEKTSNGWNAHVIFDV